MFAGLKAYQSRDFWESQPTIVFDTLYEHHTYKVFAAFKTSANEDQGFMYHRFINAADEEEFNQFVALVLERAFLVDFIAIIWELAKSVS